MPLTFPTPTKETDGRRGTEGGEGEQAPNGDQRVELNAVKRNNPNSESERDKPELWGSTILGQLRPQFFEKRIAACRGEKATGEQ